MKHSQTDVFPKEITNNFWLLGNYYFSLYLIRGREASALIETGITATCDAVIGQLDELGIAPDYIVVTHPHSDHVTGLWGLCERFPDTVPVVGEGAADFIAHPKARAAMIREDRFMAESLSKKGIMIGRRPLETFDFPERRIEAKGLYEIDLGGVTLRCLPVKGHSPGNLAVHVPEMEALMVSDSLGFHFPGRCFCPLFFTGLADYLSTIDFLSDLKPRIIGFGHQGTLMGDEAEKAFSESRAATVALVKEILSASNGDLLEERFFDRYYRDEFSIYSEANIWGCMHLLIRRAKEAEQAK